MKIYIETWGQYYKTLQTRNLQQMGRFHSNLVSILLPVTENISLDKPLAYYGIHNLPINNVL